MAARINLNAVAPKQTGGFDFTEQNRGVVTPAVTVHFGDIATAAEAFIRDSDALVGCVAWVRSPRLVDALSERPVSFIVNKEFSLRVEGHREREPLLRLRGGVPASALPAPTPSNGALEAVRCAGWAVRGKFGALLHHKFMVRLTRKGRGYIPTAVWTGSFNLTTGAESNIENGMELRDPDVVRAFLAEFARVYAISEPLAFASGTPAPGAKGTVRTPAPKRKAAPRKRKAAVKKPAAKKPVSRKPK